jgi:hypothetical protein
MSLNKIKPQSIYKNKVDTYGPPGFAPYYSTTVLAAKMGDNANQESLYIIFLFLILAVYF